MTQLGGLTVRQHERREVHFPAELVIADDQRDQIAFTAASGAPARHVIHATAIDLSPGGAGLASSKFLPRACRGMLRVLDPVPAGTRPDGTTVHDTLFEHAVRVRRTAMTGHEPAYFIGVALIDPAPDVAARIQALLERAPSVRSTEMRRA